MVLDQIKRKFFAQHLKKGECAGKDGRLRIFGSGQLQLVARENQIAKPSASTPCHSCAAGEETLFGIEMPCRCELSLETFALFGAGGTVALNKMV